MLDRRQRVDLSLSAAGVVVVVVVIYSTVWIFLSINHPFIDVYLFISIQTMSDQSQGSVTPLQKPCVYLCIL